MRRARDRFRHSIAAAVLVVTGLGPAAVVATPNGQNRETLQEARRFALRHGRALARTGRLYLVLDSERSALDLYRGSVLLRHWPVERITVGERRVCLGCRASEEAWRSAVWERPRLEPPVRRARRVIVSDRAMPPDPAQTVDWVPPTPEEEVPTPRRFVVHFSGGLGIEVVAPDADTLRVRPGRLRRMEDAMRRLAPENWDRFRIRVVMAPDEAGTLYRSLPAESVFFAIVPALR